MDDPASQRRAQNANMKALLRRVPLDDEGYTQSFTVDQLDEFKAFLNEYGFAVIKCLTPQECAATITDLFADMNEQSAATQKQKILPDDPTTWESDNWPNPSSKFLISRQPQTQQSYNNRTHPVLFRAYQAIYGDRPLLTYVDHWGIMRGTRDLVFRNGDETTIRTRDDWRYHLEPHWDVNPWTHLQDTKAGKPHQYQSLIALVDCPPEVGGFMTVPGCTNAMPLWTSLNKPSPKQLSLHSYHPPAQDFLVTQLQKVPLRAGDLLIWNGLQLHTNFPNNSEQMRLVQYVRLLPAEIVREKQHQPEKKHVAQLTLTPLGRRLCGLEDW